MSIDIIGNSNHTTMQSLIDAPGNVARFFIHIPRLSRSDSEG